MILKIEASTGWLYFETDSVELERISKEERSKSDMLTRDLTDKNQGTNMLKLLYIYRDGQLKEILEVDNNKLSYLCGSGGKTLDKLD